MYAGLTKQRTGEANTSENTLSRNEIKLFQWRESKKKSSVSWAWIRKEGRSPAKNSENIQY